MFGVEIYIKSKSKFKNIFLLNILFVFFIFFLLLLTNKAFKFKLLNLFNTGNIFF